MINAYLKKQEKSQMNKLTLHLKELEEEQAKHNVSRRKRITKIRTKIKTEKNPEKITENKRWFFEKIKLTNT